MGACGPWGGGTPRPAADFRLLGPLEVRYGGEPVPVARPKLRALLAALALSAGRALSRDQLLDRLWGTGAPASATANLHTYVCLLRRLLAPVDPSGRRLLVSRDNGYVLLVEPDQVDVARFERAARQGAQALELGRWREAAAAYDRALGEWRGPPLADLTDHAFAQSTAARLSESYLTAAEGRAEARLRLGAPAAAAAELSPLVAAHPLRESLRAQLMVALYRCGRQADALASYRALHRTLAGELGLSPSRQLQRLHEAVLLQDPELDGHGAQRKLPAAGPVAPGPPAPLTRLIGRGGELAEIAGLLDSCRLLTLTGIGGVGKTRLAIAAARRVAGRFPDGVRFVPLAAATEVARVLPAVAAALWAGAAGPDALAGHVGDRRLLLVVDNLEHLAAAAPDLTRLLAHCPGLVALITSRAPLRVYGEWRYPVPPLSLAADDGEPGATAAGGEPGALSPAARLFTERAQAVRPDFALTPGRAALIEVICRRLEGLPLAIELAAGRADALSCEQILAGLERPLELLVGGAGDLPPRQRALRASLDWSYRLLSPAARSLLPRLGRLAGDAACRCGDEVAHAAALEELSDSGLVARSPSGDGPTLRLPATVRAYAREQADGSGPARVS